MQVEQQDYRQNHGARTGAQLPPDITSLTAPLHCFAPDAPISTLMGERDIDSLRPGQMVLTNSGPRCPKITQITPTADAVFCHVPAGAFGSHVPLHDIWLSPQQPIALRLDQSAPARQPVTHPLIRLLALFGSETGMTPTLRPMPDRVILLQFDQPAVVYISGLPVHIGSTDL